MTAKDFQKACECTISGRLFDNIFNRDYQEVISLSITEMRFIVHLMQAHEGIPQTYLFDPLHNLD